MNCCSKTGIVADTMRRTRAAYHRVVRFNYREREEQNIVRQRFADVVSKKSVRDLWYEVKKIKMSHQ
jgi:hypothetical protein